MLLHTLLSCYGGIAVVMGDIPVGHVICICVLKASKEAGQALVCKANPTFDLQQNHLLHCLEKTTNHEFVDEKVYNPSCQEVIVVKQLSRSSSVSSSPGGFTFCCARRNRRTLHLPNSTTSVGLHGSVQELSTIQIKERPLANSRSSLNTQLEETVPLNCHQPYSSAAVIPVATPAQLMAVEYSQAGVVGVSTL